MPDRRPERLRPLSAGSPLTTRIALIAFHPTTLGRLADTWPRRPDSAAASRIAL